MKQNKLCLAIIFLVSVNFSFGQKTEINFNAYSGLFSFRGNGTATNSSIGWSQFDPIWRTANPYGQASKHQIGLSISLPLISYGSYFDFRQSFQQTITGFLGIGVGLTCVNTNSKNKYSISYELPFIKLISIGNKGGGTLVSVGVIETLISHKIHSNLAVVGGVNFGKYHYSSTTDLYNVQDINETYSTIGLTGGLEYHPSKVISTSLLYRPAIYSEIKTFSSFLSLSAHINLRMSKK